MVDSSWSGREPVEMLAEEFLDRRRRGETPSMAEYIERYPHLACDIRELFPALVLMDDLDPRPAELCPPPNPVPAPVRQVGDYRVLREIGRGGMGVVYEAVQVSLGRRVALKTLSLQALGDGHGQERFRREARSAARLHHTNIVPVFEVGQAGDVCYYAMQLIAGQSLHQVIEELRKLREPASTRCNGHTPDPSELATAGPGAGRSPGVGKASITLLTGCLKLPEGSTPADDTATNAGLASSNHVAASLSGTQSTHRPYYHSVARVGQQAAQALGYAHARGIVHRDVKPANLLLDESGIVWVTDFGLAKTEDDQLTRTGELPGTLRYMEPERFVGQCDARADVYALGLTLYELLVLRPAFPVSDRLQLLESIRNHEPVRPRLVDRRIPRDLETVVLKAIEKDPRQRYASADALAEDLRRYLADEPIRVRRTQWYERTWRWCRRNPWVAGLIAAVILSLALGVVTASAFAIRADASAVQAQQDRDVARRKLIDSYLSEADAIRMSRRPGQRFGALRRIRDALGVGAEIGLHEDEKVRARNIAIAALCLPDLEPGPQWSSGPDRQLPDELDPLFRKHIALCDYCSANLPRPIHSLKLGSLFSPDGRFAMYGADEYVKHFCTGVRVWRIDGAKPVCILNDLENVNEDAAAFSADSTQMAFGFPNGAVKIYETETGCLIRELPLGRGPTFCMAYHPTLHRLAVANSTEVSIWDTDTRQRLLRLSHPDIVTAVVWHPGGYRLLTAWNDQLRLWDAESGQPLTGPWLGHKTGGIRCAFSQAGDRVVSNDWTHTLRLWDADSGQLLLSSPNHERLRFSQDDCWLGLDKNRIMRVAGGQEMRVLSHWTPHGPERFTWTSLHPGGRLLAAETASGFCVVDLLSGQELVYQPGSLVPMGEGVVFDSTGALWTFGDLGLLRWPAQQTEGLPCRLRIGPPEWVANKPTNVDTTARISPGGRTVAVPLRSDGTMLIHRDWPRRELRLGPQYDVRHVFFSPDGRWVLTASHGFEGPLHGATWTKLWDADTGKLVANLSDKFRYDSLLGPSARGNWLYYAAGNDVKRVEFASLAETAGTSNESQIVPFTGIFSPNQSIRAVGSNDGTIRLMAADGDREIACLLTPEPGPILPCAFAVDETMLLANGKESGSYYVFDLRRIRQGLASLNLDWDAPPYAPRKAEEIRPAVDAPLRVDLIGTELANSRAQLAEHEIQQALIALALNPFDTDARCRLGTFSLERGQFEIAYSQLTMALALRSHPDSAYLARAQAAKGLKGWDEALADVSRFLEKCPYDRRGLLLRAEIYRVRARPNEAAADLTALLARYPEDGLLYGARADCYRAMGEKEKADADRAKALKFRANDPTRLNEVAWALLTAPPGFRDTERAWTLISKALEREPDFGLYLTTLGLAQYRQGEYETALLTLEKSQVADNSQSEGAVLFIQGMCHARLGQADMANDRFDRAVRWVSAQTDLDASAVQELMEFRVEAEGVLHAK